MKKVILRSIIPMMALTALTLAPGRISAQETASDSANSAQETASRSPVYKQPRNERLEGVWRSHLTATDCDGHTLFTARALEMFIRGGTLTSVDNAPPTEHGTGLGRWAYLGGQGYTAPFQFFDFNPDGSFAGVQKIQRTIVLGADQNHRVIRGLRGKRTFCLRDPKITQYTNERSEITSP